MPQLHQRHLAAASLCALIATASCHTVITYPGWRGDNLIRNGTFEETNGLGVGFDGSGMLFPYGMQWIYPCGGLPIAENRTNWPVTGDGAISFQPGWFEGHRSALLYVNIGLGTVPQNYSTPLVARFELRGPADHPYSGGVCLPQVPLPEGLEVKVGDHATIQVVEAAQHGAALYSCVDITFTDPADVVPPDETNCFNSTSIQFVSSYCSSSSSNSTSIPFASSDGASSSSNTESERATQSSSITSSTTPNAAARSKIGGGLERSLLMGALGALL